MKCRSSTCAQTGFECDAVTVCDVPCTYTLREWPLRGWCQTKLSGDVIRESSHNQYSRNQGTTRLAKGLHSMRNTKCPAQIRRAGPPDREAVFFHSSLCFSVPAMVEDRSPVAPRSRCCSLCSAHRADLPSHLRLLPTSDRRLQTEKHAARTWYRDGYSAFFVDFDHVSDVLTG